MEQARNTQPYPPPFTPRGIWRMARLLLARMGPAPRRLAFVPLALGFYWLLLALVSALGGQSAMRALLGVNAPVFLLYDAPILAGSLPFVLLLVCFVLLPAANGLLYLELRRCMTGRPASLGQLLRHALWRDFRRAYSTALALYACLFIVLAVAAVLAVLFAAIVLFTSVFAPSGAPLDGRVAVAIAGGGLLLLLGVLFYGLFFGVAPCANACLGLRGFAAAGDAYRLVKKNFLRAARVYMVYFLLLLLLLGIALLPLLLHLEHMTLPALLLGCLPAAVLLAFTTLAAAGLFMALYIKMREHAAAAGPSEGGAFEQTFRSALHRGQETGA